MCSPKYMYVMHSFKSIYTLKKQITLGSHVDSYDRGQIKAIFHSLITCYISIRDTLLVNGQYFVAPINAEIAGECMNVMHF